MWKAVVFDLDGTLADTANDLIDAANATFVSLGHGRVLTPETDDQVAMQGGGRAMLRHGFSRLNHSVTDAEIERLYPDLVQNYANSLCKHSYLYPGCVDALERLKQAGVGLSVCTNKPGRLAEPLLEQLGIAHYFGAVIAADTLPVRKPHPAPLLEALTRVGGEPAFSVLVGDSMTDRKSASAAGAASLLVTFGPIGEAVRDMAPHGLLDHYDDIHDTLRQMYQERHG